MYYKEEKSPSTRHKFKQLVSFIENDNFTENFVKSNEHTKITFIEMIIFLRGFHSLWRIGIT